MVLGEGQFARESNGRTRGKDFNLKEGRLRLDIRKKFFIMGWGDSENC